MKSFIKFAVFVAVIVYGGYSFINSGQAGKSYSDIDFSRMHPEIYVENEPSQISLDEKRIIEKDKFTFDLTHKFDIQALVLGAKNYRFDLQRQISKTDFVLGWGSLSNPEILKKLDITQDNRYYKIAYPFGRPMEEALIIRQIANMHMVASTESIQEKIESVRAGDLVSISGYLMNAQRDDGLTLKSSISRQDRGTSSNEIVYVESISIKKTF